MLGEQFGWHWKWQLGLFLLPTLGYGLMFLGQHMPQVGGAKKGLSLGEMFKDVGLLGALVVCFLLALFFNGALGIADDVGVRAWRARCSLASAMLTNFSIGLVPAVRAVRRPRCWSARSSSAPTAGFRTSPATS